MTPIERAQDLTSDGVIDPRTSDFIAVVGQARGYALSAGALAIACATAVAPEERAALAAELAGCVRRYRDAVAVGARMQRVPLAKSRIPREREIVHAFDARLAALPQGGEGLTRADAIDIARAAREEVVPAIYRILAVIQEDEVAEIERRMAAMREKAAIVDGMFAEMARIGRMIGIISINASVEAARAGGETGRAFQVIAEEVRTLAQRSSEVLAGMKARVIEDQAGPPVPRHGRRVP